MSRKDDMTISGNFTDLTGRNVLIVEDDWFLASEMGEAVRQAGGTVLGPVPGVEEALAIIDSTKVDAAVLDIRLGEETSFPVAAALKAKGVRVVFVSGYDDWILPSDLDDVPIYRKPADPENVVRLLFASKRGKTD